MNKGRLKTVLRCGFAILFLLVLAKILTERTRIPVNQIEHKHTAKEQNLIEQPIRETKESKRDSNDQQVVNQLETQAIRTISALVQNPDTIFFRFSEKQDHGTWQQVNMQFTIVNDAGIRVAYWFVASNKQGFSWKLYDTNRNLIDSGIGQ